MNKKSTFLIFTFLLFSYVWAQKMNTPPIFPGCENNKTKESIAHCLNKQIQDALRYELDYFTIVADYIELPEANAKISFSINQNGQFSDVIVDGKNETFNGFIFSTFYLMNTKLKKANLAIRPALDKQKNPISVTYQIPINFQLTKNQKDYPNFNTENRVLFTFFNEQDKENIEVRMDTDYILRTYAIRDDRQIYLGKFNSLVELAMVEPYAKNIENNFNSGKTLVTKGLLNDKEYTIQLKNFFNNDPSTQVFIEVFNEENNESKEYYQYKSKEEFNQSPFVSLTYRK
ncbi:MULTISPECIES: hypothetical protein [Weeksella]|uniref:hypothetical protein n=1 Tax=Weeksella TaxID=1013 RepID=UPI0008A33F68|nr:MULTISPECIES: hypothetical protein [Weeksella]MDK7375371.1 hypothetical protein [Weeksella virosa]OFM82960.1 hypothetical protein HMPREF2660_02710 [Weeksella sp. HMSC059D05]